MINFGARGHDVTWADTPELLARGLAGYGVHNVQLALPKSFPEWSGADAVNPGMGLYFRRVLAERGVDVAVLGCYINMTHPDPAAREAALRRFEAYLANARFFGAPVVASETGSVDADPGRFTEENFTERMYREALGSIRRLVAAGERFGTIVGVEPGANHPIHDIETTVRLLEDVDSPYLGIVFDPTAYTTPNGLTCDGSDQVTFTRNALDAFGDRVVAVHIDDFTTDETGIHRCNVDEGTMDVAGVLRLVAAARPLVPVILEQTTDEAIARAVRRYGNL
ncbi:sugar phosphate isomerase/epimerase family protein [Bifidobacterium avesanii]|uniref:TIM barrel protein n=1 Tax=Bifidobacterium avesanii TaxID=1798157 RepID=A0A7K3TES6_9BIFI|nr:sugar phosphate isomerase/epimerase [Bifidobacterium avesanii]KAB8295584.1 AP endonuclease, family 2 [Bifidobacterium avesanii]NEG77588.1 TIM barrel protein [Bifidobacterium avesanii]